MAPIESPETRHLIPAERRRRIAEILSDRRAVRVSTLSGDLGVSEMTIRRDLERLEGDGLLSRTHGGAILKQRMIEEPLYINNVLSHTDEKRRISQAAAAMIQPGETVFLSSGTTAAQVLRHVDPSLEARIVTHNVGAIAESQGLRIELIMLGGLYRPSANAFEGSLPVEVLARFHATKMFLSTDGVTLDEGLTTPSVGIAGVERVMVRQTRGELVALADGSKIGVVADVVVCTLDQVDTAIIDDSVGEDVRDEMKRLGVGVIIA
jgi:DeoR family transcriptional regulator, fructose operon transcriptional repressor